MKYYIDFDHTLYNTNALIEDMLHHSFKLSL